MIEQLIMAVISAGFDIEYRRTWLADAYVDYDKGEIVIGKEDGGLSLLHECVHVLYDEMLDESLPETAVEETAKKILTFEGGENHVLLQE